MDKCNCTTLECFNICIEGQRSKVNELTSSYDVFWVLMATVLVFFMQAGFAMLEAGTVRRMNVSNILFKNAFDPVMAALMWWICGYAFALGRKDNSTVNAFIGNGDFFLVSDGHKEEENYGTFIFQWAFCATAATIVSGAIAERCYITAYFVYSLFLCGLLYPLVVHWVWSNDGWLSISNNNLDRLHHGMMDFAGSGVVHMVGGFSALAGAFVVGPRMGWVENQQRLAASTTVEERREAEVSFAPHDKTLMTLGTLILWFGWFGFNCGSTGGLKDGNSAVIAGKVGVATVLGAAGGGLGTLLLTVALDPEHRLLLDPVFNGILSGLVSITAGCAFIEPWAALVIGLIGGFFYVGASALVKKLGIDDVLDAAAVHGFCGYWGLVAVGFFASDDNIDAGDLLMGDDRTGVFYGGNGKQLGTQLLGGSVIMVWSFVLSFLLFTLLKVTGSLRVPAWVELYGLDYDEHGSFAFSTSFHAPGTLEMQVIKRPAPLPQQPSGEMEHDSPPEPPADEAGAEPKAIEEN